MKLFIGKSKIRQVREGSSSTRIFLPSMFVKGSGLPFETELNVYMIDNNSLLLEPVVDNSQQKI